jgi:hypothetical protein
MSARELQEQEKDRIMDDWIDLNAWHHALHQVTGAMALKFNRATPHDLERWAEMLQAVAAEMRAANKTDT